MKCPKCISPVKVKSGKIKGVQRYKCKDCGCNYTVELNSKSFKKQALHLYLEGLGFRSIGRFLRVSNVTILRWIRSFGKELQELHSEDESIEVVELDEMHTYISQKKTIVGSG